MFSANTSQIAAGGGALYVEDVMSTFLYTGNRPSTQTVTNGIDLSGKGGMVWVKNRASATFPNNTVFDTARGAGAGLITNSTAAQDTSYTQSFSSTGFDLGGDNGTNQSGITYVSWTFREAPKFFDVVTYTGSGTSSRTISHNLGAQPKFIIIKRTDTTSNWVVTADKGVAGEEYYLNLNTTDAGTQGTSGPAANGYAGINGASDDTFFNIYSGSSGNSAVNASGGTYVAYLFASNAGGFGLTGTDNVISCGSFTVDGSGNATVNLGYEPQWVMVKTTGTASNWIIIDTMRGYSSSQLVCLFPNTSGAESDAGDAGGLTATGFKFNGQYSSGTSLIYIAIRRGPMRVPTDASTVFKPTARTGTGTSTTITSGFVNDSVWSSQRGGGDRGVFDRLRGPFNALFQNSTVSENGYYTSLTGFDNNAGVAVGADAVWGGINASGASIATYGFQRAPGFFDVVCYTGTGTYGAANHNLGVTPELIIYKSRSSAVNWGVIKPVSSIAYYDGLLNSNSAFTYYSNDPSVAGLYTSTQFCKYQDTSSYTYVAYLFATCAGVSKVGSYTGNGSTQTINCGFTGGARFVLIKRTDATGNWYVYDTARGMTTLTDPYLLINSTAAEVATLGSVTTVSTGFALNSTILAAINVSAGTYIFFAVA